MRLEKPILERHQYGNQILMSNALIDFFFDYEKSALSESLRNWQRLLNVPNVPRIAAETEFCYSPHDVVYSENSL